MPKITADVIEEWVKRSYITRQQAVDDSKMYTSFIEQAKDYILSFCNIPLKASMPDGLFYAWVEISYATSKNKNADSNLIKSIQEGDTTVQFGANTAANATTDYTAILNSYRRMP